MEIDRIDHFVLTVRKMEKTCLFYQKVLGMRVLTFGKGQKALKFGNQKINLHEFGNELTPRAVHPFPGSGDFCLLSADPIEDIIDHVRSCNVQILEGPVERAGANGPITSIYFRDPDLNLIEVAVP